MAGFSLKSFRETLGNMREICRDPDCCLGGFGGACRYEGKQGKRYTTS
jgi:hypothetical protein